MANHPTPTPREPAFSSEVADEILARAKVALEANPDIDELALVDDAMDRLIPAAEAEAKRLREHVKSPLLERAEINQAVAAAQSAELDAERLRRGQDLISERLATAKSAEAQAKRKDDYMRVVAERNAVATEIRETYPKLVAQYVGLCERIMASNEEVERINRDRPDGLPPLDTAEATARGFSDKGGLAVAASLNSFRITQGILPAMESSQVAWPPTERGYRLAILDRRMVHRQAEIASMWRPTRER